MFWPNGARIAVATSLMFEAGSQDLRKALGPIPVQQEGDLPDLPTNSWFDYAANEGIPRYLTPIVKNCLTLVAEGIIMDEEDTLGS